MPPSPLPPVPHRRLSAAKALTVAVVADTHSAPHPDVLGHLRALRPDAILHGGDIGDLAVLEALEQVAPVHAVRGNIDGRGCALPDGLVLDLEAGGRALRLFLTHIAVAGPRLRADAARAARAAGAQLVVCGHSHLPFIGEDRGLAIFNPGSVGPRRFHLPIVFGVLALDAKGVHLGHRDAATGKPWLPG